MYSIITILSFLSLFSSLLFSHQVTATQQSITLLSSDPQGVTVELTLTPYDIQTVQLADGICQKIQLPEWASTVQLGFPQLPITGALIQVPAKGKLTTQLVSSDHYSLPAFIPCPVPQLESSANGELIENYVKNEKGYQETNFYPTTLFQLEQRALWRDLSVARLILQPFQWNASTQELRYYTRLRLRIDFEKSLPVATVSARSRSQSVADSYQDLFYATVLNYQGMLSSTRSTRDTTVSEETVYVRAKAPEKKAKTMDNLRIEIKEEGFYGISYEELANAGAHPELMRPENLQLFNQGQQVPFKVIFQNRDKLLPGDFLLFYAQALNDSYTDTNVYWLYWRKKGQGWRIVPVDGQVTGKGQLLIGFYERFHFEKNIEDWDGMPLAPEGDFWFWERLNPPSNENLGTYNYSLPPIPSPLLEMPESTIRVAFYGRSNMKLTNPDHHTVVALNDSVIGDDLWDDVVPHIQEMKIPTNLIKQDNTLSIKMVGDTGAQVDVAYFNWMEVEYWRHFMAVNNSLRFTVGHTEQMQMTLYGFTEPTIMIYDITDPHKISEVVNFLVEPDGQTYKVTFEAPAKELATYYALSTSQLKKPNKLIGGTTSQLKSVRNAADYILITAKNLLPAVQPLVDLRKKQGLRVEAVSVEDIYNEFNEGIFSPSAIKEFLAYAYQNWQEPAPTYVFLVGDASMDYHKYKGRKDNVVPAHLFLDSLEGRLVPEDTWYVSVQGDDSLPEMFVGRIPGNTPIEVSKSISKIVSFEENTTYHSNQVLLVADDQDEEFEKLNENLVTSYIPTDTVGIERVYLSTYPTPEQATQDIVINFNKGMMLVNYIGHGSTTQWWGLFKSSDIKNLYNEDKLPFVLTLTCVNGFFSHPNTASLAEEFVNHPTKGAIAVFAPSSFSYTWQNAMLSNEIFSNIFQGENLILGSVTTRAKVIAFIKGVSAEVISTYNLFGDPAVTLKNWK